MVSRTANHWRNTVILSLLSFSLSPALAGQQRRRPPMRPPAPHAVKAKNNFQLPPKGQVVTQHSIRIHGTVLNYTATAGTIALHDTYGKLQARVFYVAYTLPHENAVQRPLTFCFNGGPGSSTVWLHLGGIGPQRVVLQPNGLLPRPPFQIAPNPETILPFTDLVFIDAIGTGYSRSINRATGRQFWGLEGDLHAFGEFIRLYLNQNGRWTSPLFLLGESYGTTRAAGLAGYLERQGIALNGISLLSTVLDFRTLSFAHNNDLPYVLYVPSYADTAWYHHQLSPALEKLPVSKVSAEAKAFAQNVYYPALMAGSSLPAAQKEAVARQLSRFTGLTYQYVLRSDLRIPNARFDRELLRNRNLAVGRLDSRYTAWQYNAVGEYPSYDPSDAALTPPFTSMLYHYLRQDLNYKTNLYYYILGGGIGPWNFSRGPRGYAGWGGYPNVSGSLRRAFEKNPYLKVFVAMGYYDLATPYMAVEYTLNQMHLAPSARASISTAFYHTGHMIYVDQTALAKLHNDLLAFYRKAAPGDVH